jgi:hypothetical protein
MLAPNKNGYFPYTPATNLLYGLREALKILLDEEGLDNVFARHQRHAEATRRAVNAWGLELVCQNPAEYSPVLTAVMMPAGHSEVAFRKVVLEHFNMSLGSGLGKVADKVFRIGHLGDFNDLTLMGTLAGVEMGLELAGVPHKKGGVDAAMAYLTSANAAAKTSKAQHKGEVSGKYKVAWADIAILAKLNVADGMKVGEKITSYKSQVRRTLTILANRHYKNAIKYIKSSATATFPKI